jgi:hypothetical protein
MDWDWFWMPLLGWHKVGLAVLLLSILAVVVIGATWSVHVPGAVTPTERQRRPQFIPWGNAWLLAYVHLLPLLLPLSAVLMLFPLSQPCTVFLSSRAAQVDSAAWQKAWECFCKDALKNSEETSFLDAGPIVDEACRNLKGEPADPRLSELERRQGRAARRLAAIQHRTPLLYVANGGSEWFSADGRLHAPTRPEDEWTHWQNSWTRALITSRTWITPLGLMALGVLAIGDWLRDFRRRYRAQALARTRCPNPSL